MSIVLNLPPLQPAEKKMLTFALRDIRFAAVLLKQAYEKFSLFNREHSEKKKKMKVAREKIGGSTI
ncbi:TPA: hypothetical protein DF272_04140 [Candidatus Falkowbacteria bacterium]|nr:hypothetical protein [Candidatus Falkowbacteria bacterium]